MPKRALAKPVTILQRLYCSMLSSLSQYESQLKQQRPEFWNRLQAHQPFHMVRRTAAQTRGGTSDLSEVSSLQHLPATIVGNPLTCHLSNLCLILLCAS